MEDTDVTDSFPREHIHAHLLGPRRLFLYPQGLHLILVRKQCKSRLPRRSAGEIYANEPPCKLHTLSLYRMKRNPFMSLHINKKARLRERERGADCGFSSFQSSPCQLGCTQCQRKKEKKSNLQTKVSPLLRAESQRETLASDTATSLIIC